MLTVASPHAHVKYLYVHTPPYTNVSCPVLSCAPLYGAGVLLLRAIVQCFFILQSTPQVTSSPATACDVLDCTDREGETPQAARSNMCPSTPQVTSPHSTVLKGERNSLPSPLLAGQLALKTINRLIHLKVSQTHTRSVDPDEVSARTKQVAALEAGWLPVWQRTAIELA